MKKRLFISGCLAASLIVSSMVVFAQSFSDTKNHWAESTIEWGKANGYITGYPDGTFKPNNSVTEAEMLTMLLSSLGAPINKEDYTKHWADPYYEFAQEMNYPTSGFNELGLRNAKIPRVKVAELVSSTQGVHYIGEDAIKYLLVMGLAKGKTSATVEGFGGDDLLTRAEAIAFLQNVIQEGIGDLKPRPAQPSDTTELNKQYEEMVNKQKTEQAKQDDTVWKPGPVRVVADQLFPSYKDNGNSVTVTMPIIDGYGYVATYRTRKYKAIDPNYKYMELEEGQTYTFQKGDGGQIGISIQGKDGVNVETYFIRIDEGIVFDIDRNEVTIDAILKGLGVKP